MKEPGQTVVMVTHDPTAAAYADRVVLPRRRPGRRRARRPLASRRSSPGWATSSTPTDMHTPAFLDDQFATAASGVDVTVQSAVAFDSAMGVEVERDPVTPAIRDRIARIPGVSSAIGVAGWLRTHPAHRTAR